MTLSLPPPEALAQYEALLPRLAHRVVKMVESAEAHRQELEQRETTARIARHRLMSWHAFALILLGLLGLLFVTSCALASSSTGCTQRSPERSAAAVRAFRKANPCPATGQTTGACPGWQVDHRTPLCCGGPDAPENMRWLSVEEHKARHAGGVRCEVKP